MKGDIDRIGAKLIENPVEKMHGRQIGRFFLSNVVILGMTSLFMDMSTEMVYPLIPLYLAAFGSGPAVLGIIEGIAESLACFLRVVSGYIGDKTQQEKGLAFTGYSLSVVYKVILLLATSWLGVLVARSLDRVGKGIRTAPRDALVAQAGGDKKLGRAFGLHKMLDMLGQAIGILLAFFIVGAGMGFDSAFMWSMIPAVLAILVLLLVKTHKREGSRRGARDDDTNDKTAVPASSMLSRSRVRALFSENKRFILFLLILFGFSLGNFSAAFLLLRASDAGLSAPMVIMMYFLSSVAASALAYPFGRLSDRVGRAGLLVPGYVVYGAVYLGFAFFGGYVIIVPLLFVGHGIYTALVAGAERAFVAEQAKPEYRGTVLGVYGLCQGGGLLIASLLAGALWTSFGAGAPFLFGGVVGLLAAIGIRVLLGSRKSGY